MLIVIDRDERSGLRMSRRRNRNLETVGWTTIPNSNLMGRCKFLLHTRIEYLVYNLMGRCKFVLHTRIFSLATHNS